MCAHLVDDAVIPETETDASLMKTITRIVVDYVLSIRTQVARDASSTSTFPRLPGNQAVRHRPDAAKIFACCQTRRSVCCRIGRGSTICLSTKAARPRAALVAAAVSNDARRSTGTGNARGIGTIEVDSRRCGRVTVDDARWPGGLQGNGSIEGNWRPNGPRYLAWQRHRT